MTEVTEHPFQRTLGEGPYRFVGMFYIDIAAGKQGRPYVNPAMIHPRFVSGAGTCEHCGQAILNVCQIQIGNGDVYGVGTDCVEKVSLPIKELTLIQKAKRARDKLMRAARKQQKGDNARAALKQIIDEQADRLQALEHPTTPYRTLLDYAQFILARSSNGGVVIGLYRVEKALAPKGER